MTLTVNIWWCDLNRIAEDAAYRALAPDEQQRFHRLIDPAKRAQFSRARFFLRHALCRYTNIPAESARLVIVSSGKPVLHPSDNADDWHFNLSHTGKWAVCAIAQGIPLGIDIEMIRDVQHLTVLAARVLPPADYQAFLRQVPVIQRLMFFTAWTQQEALQKLSDADTPPEHRLFPLHCPDGVIGHIAVPSAAPIVLQTHDFDPSA